MFAEVILSAALALDNIAVEPFEGVVREDYGECPQSSRQLYRFSHPFFSISIMVSQTESMSATMP